MSELNLRRDADVDQSKVLKAFADGRLHGIAEPAERIETHLNYIFLTGDRAYKIKRKVRMPFVDFTTIESRRAACEAELTINCSLGSPFYLGVEPIVREANGTLRLGRGEGVEVDWSVVMKRFDRAGQFDILAKEGGLTVEMVEAASEQVAILHARASPVRDMGHAADYRQIIRQLRRTEADGAHGMGLSISRLSPYDQLENELTRIDILLETRRRHGKVCRTHGDLHLRNICVFEGKPVLFDALEFDERMATTDVLYDLAFLLMDLRFNGLLREANAAMNRYWDVSGEDESALQLLPFFTSLRAVVRMAIAIEAGQLEEAGCYRDLATELLTRKSARYVALGGLSGSGKSAVASRLAPSLSGPAGGRVLRTDVLRKRSAGLSIFEQAPASVYAPAEREEVYKTLVGRAGEALAAGASVILDGTFASETSRALLCGALDGKVRCFWMDAPLEVRRARVALRTNDPSDADVRIVDAQEEPRLLPKPWKSVDAQRPVSLIASELLELIS